MKAYSYIQFSTDAQAGGIQNGGRNIEPISAGAKPKDCPGCTTRSRPFAPQSLNNGREFHHKGTPIPWFHWCLFVFIGGLTESLRLSRIHAVEKHEWTLMNTNLRTRTMIQPFAPQSLNDGREFRRKGLPSSGSIGVYSCSLVV
jgi:hypothetical protein